METYKTELKVTTTFEAERKMHSAFFDQIKNEENWKYPIHCIVPEHFFKQFNAACRFFTASHLEIVKHHAGGMVECKANGYYIDCGA